MQTDVGYWTKCSGEELIAQLIRVLTTPTCAEEEVRVNTALKVLCMRRNAGHAGKFHTLMSEGLHRKLIYTS